MTNILFEGKTQTIPTTGVFKAVLNVRLGWLWMAATNTLAYSNEVLIGAVKSFILQAPGELEHVSGSVL